MAGLWDVAELDDNVKVQQQDQQGFIRSTTVALVRMPVALLVFFFTAAVGTPT